MLVYAFLTVSLCRCHDELYYNGRNGWNDSGIVCGAGWDDLETTITTLELQMESFLMKITVQ